MNRADYEEFLSYQVVAHKATIFTTSNVLSTNCSSGIVWIIYFRVPSHFCSNLSSFMSLALSSIEHVHLADSLSPNNG